MEGSRWSKRPSKIERSKRKRRRVVGLPSCSSVESTDVDKVTCLLLAAFLQLGLRGRSSSIVSSLFVKKCLSKVLSFLSKLDEPISSSQPVLPATLLALLPVLLKSNVPDIASLSAQVVGMASLWSLEMNQEIASDREILDSVMWGLRSSNKRVKISACSAVLDLSTSSVARKRLLELPILETLIVSCLQVAKYFLNTVTSCTVENGLLRIHVAAAKEHELPVLLLEAVIVLINACDIKQVEAVPADLSENFLVFLKELWTKVNLHLSSSLDCIQQKDIYISNVRVNDLAESIFRFSISGQRGSFMPIDEIERSIFGIPWSGFKDFILGHWEKSPFCLSTAARSVDEEGIFSTLWHSINPKDVVHDLLCSVLQSMVSCPPVASDELCILNFLNQERENLGVPIIYLQDIRVLKTEVHSNSERHLFLNSLSSCTQSPHVFGLDDIFKCEEAYKDGYTVAMRGMEFRFKSIAAITEGLASLFGQPSVGANLYLTPPSSQGLARHLDDHCVLVCQLSGSKQWTIFPPRDKLLPHLYEVLDVSHGSEIESSPEVCMKILLKEGDILYIPRGCLHEAHTFNDEPKDSVGPSLHLTLAIEVEAPFEWEGFIHIALKCWFQNPKQLKTTYSSCGNLDTTCIRLLHIMIGLLGDADPMFRKACLVNSVCFSWDSSNWLYQNQASIFQSLVDKINKTSKFTEVLQKLKKSIEKKEDPFRRIRWLEIFNQEEEAAEGYRCYALDNDVEDIHVLFGEETENLEAAFLVVKSEFCEQVLFEDAVPKQKVLLKRYRKVRKQYLNGMLSLHCKLD